MDRTATADEHSRADAPGQTARPGLLLACTGGEPRFVPVPLSGEQGALGRDELLSLGIHDDQVSRSHLHVAFSAGVWTVRDLGSKNGVHLDGTPLRRPWSGTAPRVARVGRTLVLFRADISACERSGLDVRDGVVQGPALREAHDRVLALARGGATVLLTGETGTGKEVAARAYHAATGRGPFVAVNCATIPRELAERLLFGTRKGAYSGAVADADGHVQAAGGGTLFLDEIGELDLAVQAKLLRVLEAREVQALGATAAEPVDLRLCAATTRDLRQDVAAGRFRDDLYFRMGRPEVRLPPLRDRPEEIPWLIAGAVRGTGQTPSLSLVEACLLRRWPGNVRELCTEVRTAALLSSARSSATVDVEHLASDAGGPLADPAAPEDPQALSVRRALAAAAGNITEAAAHLNLSRAALRRLIAKHHIDVKQLKS